MKLLFSLLFFITLLFAQHKDHVHTVIIPKNWQPYYLVDKDGKPSGFAIDLFEAIAKESGIKYEYKIVPSWNEMWAPFENAEAHIIPDLGISKKREAFTVFSDFTNTFELVLFKRTKSSNIKTIQDLYGKKVAVVHRNLGEKVMTKYNKIQKVVYDTHFEAIRALLSGEVDGFCYPKTLLDFTLRSLNIEDKIVYFGKSLFEVKRGVGISNKHAALLEPVNEAISKIKNNGTYDKIYNKWFQKPKLIEFTQQEIVIVSAAVVFVIILAFFLIFFISTRKKWLVTQKDLQNEIKNKTKILQEKDEYLNTVFDTIPSLIFTKDDHGMVSANENFLSFVKYKDHETINKEQFCIGDLFKKHKDFLEKNIDEEF
jgi:ABC-type amino acid transport substrate-binding protein